MSTSTEWSQQQKVRQICLRKSITRLILKWPLEINSKSIYSRFTVSHHQSAIVFEPLSLLRFALRDSSASFLLSRGLHLGGILETKSQYTRLATTHYPLPSLFQPATLDDPQ